MGINVGPEVITHCAPHSIETDLNTTFVLIRPINQTYISMGTPYK